MQKNQDGYEEDPYHHQNKQDRCDEVDDQADVPIHQLLAMIIDERAFFPLDQPHNQRHQETHKQRAQVHEQCIRPLLIRCDTAGLCDSAAGPERGNMIRPFVAVPISLAQLVNRIPAGCGAGAVDESAPGDWLGY